MSDSLGEALPRECARVRELIPMYAQIPTGGFAIAMMEQALRRADHAMMTGDLSAMIKVYNELREFE